MMRFSTTKPYPLQESKSKCVNLPQCAAQTSDMLCRRPIVAQELKESKEAEDASHCANENDYKEIMCPSMDPPVWSPDFSCESSAEELPQEVTMAYAVSAASDVATPKCSEQGKLSFDEITALMGADTFVSSFADNLFREEGGRAQPWFSARNRMPAGRKKMVDWIRTTSGKHQFADATQFRALFYLDKLCATKDVVSKHLQTTAAVCLYIAAKYNEVDANVPRLSRFCGRHLDVDVMIESEVSIVSAFGFQLKAVLPIDFVSHWIGQQQVVFADDLIGDVRASAGSIKQCLKSMECFSVFFLNITSSDHGFWAYPASALAAAVLCAARRVLRIAPYWNRKLASVVRHEPQDLEHCFNALWTEYERRFPSKCKSYTSMQPKTMADFR